jgi:hypothetical protein
VPRLAAAAAAAAAVGGAVGSSARPTTRNAADGRPMEEAARRRRRLMRKSALAAQTAALQPGSGSQVKRPVPGQWQCWRCQQPAWQLPSSGRRPAAGGPSLRPRPLGGSQGRGLLSLP